MKQALRPVKRRIRFLRCIQGLLWGLLIAAAACLVLAATSFFVPIEEVWRYLVAIAVVCPVVGALIGLLWPVTTMRAARRADDCGLKERTLTALVLADENTPMAQLQRRDAQAALTALPVKKCMPVTVKRPLWVATLAMAVALFVLLVVPNPQNDVLRERLLVRQQLAAQADELEQAAEKMAEEGLTKEEAQKLRRLTGDMARELRTADDKRDALEKLDAKQKEMDKLQKEIQQRIAQDTAQALGSQSMLKGLSEAMESGSESGMQEAIEALAEKVDSMEGAKELSEQLSEAAASASASSAKQSLSQSAQAAQSGNVSQFTQAMASACQGSSAASSANLSALMSMARSGVAQSGSKSMSATGSGSGSGGQGMGPGGGAGTGSTNRDMGYREGFSQSSQQSGGRGITDKVGTYEAIYDPTRLGGDNESSFVEGEVHEGETQQMQIGPGVGDVSGSVPYNEVIGEYQEAAAQAMQRTSLPSALQEWVSRYFNALID